MGEVKVTVLMPAYNAAAYIREAVDSVLQQTFTAFELLIVNDGSTDDTEAIVRSYTDQRIKLISQQNGGVSAALNTGLQHARADLIARFDADDICYPNRLQLQYDFMSSDPDYVVVGSDADYIDINGNHLFHSKNEAYDNAGIMKQVQRSCPFIHSTVMYKKSTVLEAGGYNIHAHTFEDHLLWIKIVPLGKCCNFDVPLIKVRFNPSSVTVDEKWRPKRFIELKKKALCNGNMTQQEGNELYSLIKTQDTRDYKEAAYFALIGKKYLWNNYNSSNARKNLVKAIRLQPLKSANYFLYLLSFLPPVVITKLYKASKSKKIRTVLHPRYYGK